MFGEDGAAGWGAACAGGVTRNGWDEMRMGLMRLHEGGQEELGVRLSNMI